MQLALQEILAGPRQSVVAAADHQRLRFSLNYHRLENAITPLTPVLQHAATNHRINLVPPSTIRIALVTLAVVATAACSKPSDAKNPAAPTSSAEAPLYA